MINKRKSRSDLELLITLLDKNGGINENVLNIRPFSL